MQQRTSPDVETYLAKVPEPMRSALEDIREVVWSLVPEAEEVIAYGIPTFRLDGNLIHYAAFKKHGSFFPGAVVLDERFRSDLEGFKVSKGTIQFTPEKPLTETLLRRIVALRIEQNRQAAASRGGKARAKKPSASAS